MWPSGMAMVAALIPPTDVVDEPLHGRVERFASHQIGANSTRGTGSRHGSVNLSSPPAEAARTVLPRSPMQPISDHHARRGQTIGGNYILGDVIGVGGMGVVYTAVQRTLGRVVAVKVPRSDLTARDFVHARFRNEAIAGSRLTHRNLVAVLDFGDDNGSPFLVTECVYGTLLGRLIAEGGPMPIAVIANLANQLLDGLAECHYAGIIHADVKCDNILVQTLRDGTEVPRLIDFGLARFIDDTAPVIADRVLSGTPEYLAPEVIRGEPPSVATDLYAVGVLLYELLTGTTPFAGGTCREILARHLDEQVIPPSLRCPERTIPLALERVVMRALDKRPDERFPDAAECAAALRAATVDTPAHPEPPLPRTITAGFSTEATTFNLDRDDVPPPRRLAIGSNCEDDSLVDQTRVAVATARQENDVDRIICSYLELARLLVDDRRLGEAATELEDCVALLGAEVSSEPPALWRVLLTLAALYSGLGDPKRARDAALAGHEHAGRARSAIGVDRATALLARFSRPVAPPPARRRVPRVTGRSQR